MGLNKSVCLKRRSRFHICPMLYKTLRAAVYGIDASIIEVEVDVSGIKTMEDHFIPSVCPMPPSNLSRRRGWYGPAHARDLRTGAIAVIDENRVLLSVVAPRQVLSMPLEPVNELRPSNQCDNCSSGIHSERIASGDRRHKHSGAKNRENNWPKREFMYRVVHT